MAAIPPNTYLEGFKKSMCDGIDGAFNKGVKYGRYLEQQKHMLLIRCKKCEYGNPDPIGREGILFCEEWERFTQSDGYCHKASKKMDAEVRE